MLIAFENDPIYEDIGSDTAKIQFMQTFPLRAHFASTHSSFHVAGLFQLKDGKPVLVLPWFMKNYYDYNTKTISSEHGFHLLESIKEIKTLLSASANLSYDSLQLAGVDLICFSFLNKLKQIVIEMLSRNYHEEITEKGNTIKGRWHLNKDLAKTPKPLKFTCTYGTLEKDTVFFRLIKSACVYLREIVKSKKNLSLLDDILSPISEVATVQLTKGLLLEAKFWIRTHKNENSLHEIANFIENLFFGKNLFNPSAGLCYQFSMDKFFEELVYNLIAADRTLNVIKQSREDLLGGASWIGDYSISEFQDDYRTANQISIPDLIVKSDLHFSIFECKYKPLRIPFINDADPSQSLSSFSRNDRNQILSFILSLSPSEAFLDKQVSFVVVFPSSYVETFKISELRFEYSELELGSHDKRITQHSKKTFSNHNLHIKFLAINIPYYLKNYLNKKTTFFDEVSDALIAKTKISPEAG